MKHVALDFFAMDQFSISRQYYAGAMLKSIISQSPHYLIHISYAHVSTANYTLAQISLRN
jgi:hypothetical protein